MRKSELGDLRDWEVLCRFLPNGWEAQARSSGALQRCRGIGDAETLLRVLMIHLFHGCSLVETAARAKQTGLAEVSSVALFKRLRKSEEWLRWLAQGVRCQIQGNRPGWQRVVRAIDATTVSEPGSTGTNWRVHYSLDLSSLQCDYFEITDARGGETSLRYPVRAGDILVGDRVYGNLPGVSYVVQHQGDVIMRWQLGRPLVDEKGRPTNLLDLVKGLRVGQVREHRVGVGNATESIPGRLIVVKRTRVATQEVRKRIRQKLRRRQMSKQVYRAAQYFFVWTSLQDPGFDTATVLEIYRLRWQIELAFKRLKSLMGLGHLPKKDPPSARAWMHGKLLAGLLAERIIASASAFSPWGYSLEPTTESLERDCLHAP